MVALSLVRSILLAVSAIAIPTQSKRYNAPIKPEKSRGPQGTVPHTKNATFTPSKSMAQMATMQSSYWAGAMSTYHSGSVTSVSATWVLTGPSIPPGGNSSTAFWATPFLGIDGVSRSTGLWAGIAYSVQGSDAEYDAWYQWADDTVYPGTLSFETGDSVRVVVIAESRTAGSVTITNLTSGRSITQALVYPAYPLYQESAEWLVSSLESVPFANFGSVTFTDTLVTFSNGATTGIDDADTMEMMDTHGLVIGSTALNSDGTVTVKYVEEWADF